MAKLALALNKKTESNLYLRNSRDDLQILRRAHSDLYVLSGLDITQRSSRNVVVGIQMSRVEEGSTNRPFRRITSFR